MAGFLTNTMANYTRRISGAYDVADYTSTDIVKVHNYINSLPQSMFDYYQVKDDDKWERIALELYKNPNYWDILMIINSRNPLTGLPFSLNTIYNMADTLVNKYETNMIGVLSPEAKAQLYTSFERPMVSETENNRVIKIIKSSQINQFLQDGFDKGVF